MLRYIYPPQELYEVVNQKVLTKESLRGQVIRIEFSCIYISGDGFK